MSASLNGYTKHGVLPSTLRYMMQNLFHFPIDFQDTLESYRLIYWSPVYLEARIKDGTVCREGSTDTTRYNIIYHRCSPTSIKTQKQVRLSFRKPAPEYDMEAYVLITPSDFPAEPTAQLSE